jgi:hypothetical protein
MFFLKKHIPKLMDFQTVLDDQIIAVLALCFLDLCSLNIIRRSSLIHTDLVFSGVIEKILLGKS